jgi:hypothetical protein
MTVGLFKCVRPLVISVIGLYYLQWPQLAWQQFG